MPTCVGMQAFFTYLHLYQRVVNSTHRPLHDRNEFLHGQMASLNPYKEALEVNYKDLFIYLFTYGESISVLRAEIFLT